MDKPSLYMIQLLTLTLFSINMFLLYLLNLLPVIIMMARL